MPTFHIKVSGVECLRCSDPAPCNVYLGRQQLMAQLRGSLASTKETWIEFQTPGLTWANVGIWGVKQEMQDLCLSLSLVSISEQLAWFPQSWTSSIL